MVSTLLDLIGIACLAAFAYVLFQIGRAHV